MTRSLRGESRVRGKPLYLHQQYLFDVEVWILWGHVCQQDDSARSHNWRCSTEATYKQAKCCMSFFEFQTWKRWMFFGRLYIYHEPSSSCQQLWRHSKHPPLALTKSPVATFNISFILCPCLICTLLCNTAIMSCNLCRFIFAHV